MVCILCVLLDTDWRVVGLLKVAGLLLGAGVWLWPGRVCLPAGRLPHPLLPAESRPPPPGHPPAWKLGTECEQI